MRLETSGTRTGRRTGLVAALGACLLLAASPAFADGKIYVRTKEKLFAFGAK